MKKTIIYVGGLIVLSLSVCNNASAQGFFDKVNNALDKTSKKIDKAIEQTDKVLGNDKNTEGTKQPQNNNAQQENKPTTNQQQSAPNTQNSNKSTPAKTEEAPKVKGSSNQVSNEVPKGKSTSPMEPVYMGLTGQFNSVEVTCYSGPNKKTVKTKPLGDFQQIDVYSFDNNGRLLEKCCYANLTKKTLMGKDTYKRDKEGNITEAYSGFNLNDKHYISESLWRMIKKEGNKELWQEINEDDWWGTSYKEIEYLDNRKNIKRYVIQKKSGETSNLESITEIFNQRGQIVSEISDKGSNHPKNTTIRTYSDSGYLLKEEMEQLHTDGSINKVEMASFTINKVDEHGNPLQVTDNQGQIKIYKYSYIK